MVEKQYYNYKNELESFFNNNILFQEKYKHFYEICKESDIKCEEVLLNLIEKSIEYISTKKFFNLLRQQENENGDASVTA